jgi:[glutamine synthetase] adenylyltransferase / [glutamine synthetase]-adenylyl-L-tyrosine phosphorylase
MSAFLAEQHSEFFRRSLSAWQQRSSPAWLPVERLTADVEHPLTADRIAQWFEELMLMNAASSSSASGSSNQADRNRSRAEPVSSSTVGQVLRRVRNWLMLCIIERDLSGRADLAEVCSAMTLFAEFSSRKALQVLAAEHSERHGLPLDEAGIAQDLLIIAMGKAGGGELNVSSDLDVVFVVRDDGESSGVAPTGNRARVLSSAEFYHQLARQWIALMSENDEFGFVFRIDARLRPNGDSGPLVVTLSMLEHYFFSQAREWERFAWLKSRCIANSGLAPPAQTNQDLELLDAMVRPFVFRRYHDFNAFNALRALHARIRNEVGKKDSLREGSYDVKLGRGGIREIEFIAQLFQIVRGGRDADLRSLSTLKTLATLAEKRLLPEHDAQELARAYDLLRRIEHALQYREDAQTHRLALAAPARAGIAAMLRLSPTQFEAQLLATTQAVQRVFDQLLNQSASRQGSIELDGEPPDAALAATLAAADPHPIAELADAARQAIAPQLLVDPELVQRIDTLHASVKYQSARPETQQSIAQLLAAAQATQTPAVGVIRLIDLIETVIGRPAYLALLALYPRALSRVLKMLSQAKWASEYLNRHPIVLDELLDGQLLEPVLYKPWGDALAGQLKAAVHDGTPDIERQMDLAREAHHAQEFRLLAQDIEGLLSVERLSDYLSELADQTLEVVLQVLWAQLPGRIRDEPQFAIIAYGKLGGKELGYASDLDLVFLYDDDDERAAECYARLAQRLSGWLSLRTAAGILFDIDVRLRPNGNAGLLVTTLAGFQEYQRSSAWVWEHQALTRARFAAGHRGIGAQFEAIRQEIIAQPREQAQLAIEVRAMRQKMLEGHPNRSALFDLKHDRGGMVDIEFIVQYLVLAHSHQFSELRADAGNIALLSRAGKLGLIDLALAERVANTYRDYRMRQHRLRLNGAAYSRVAPDTVQRQKEEVLALWASSLAG